MRWQSSNIVWELLLSLSVFVQPECTTQITSRCSLQGLLDCFHLHSIYSPSTLLQDKKVQWLLNWLETDLHSPSIPMRSMQFVYSFMLEVLACSHTFTVVRIYGLHYRNILANCIVHLTLLKSSTGRAHKSQKPFLHSMYCGLFTHLNAHLASFSA